MLSLGELGCATCSLEAVLLALLHARIAGQIAGLLDDRLVVLVRLHEGAGDAMTDGAGLAGEAAALAVDDDVELAGGFGQVQGLTDDHLQGLIAEVLVQGALVDDDVTLAGDQTNASDRLFSSANGMEANSVSHFSSSSLITA